MTVSKISFLQADELAKKYLQDKKRLSGETYYDHVLKVVNKLKKYGIKDETTLKIALLHHIPDQTSLLKIKPYKYKEEFDEEILNFIEGYHKLSETRIKTESLRNFNEKYLIQTVINLVGDVRILTVRIADRLEDLETSLVLSKEKREEKAIRAMYLYAPLAKILGINALANDLEDAAFKNLLPMEYYSLGKLVNKKKHGIKKNFREIEKFLKQILSEHGLTDFHIEYRAKGLYSTYKKMIRYDPKMEYPEKTLERIYDLFALRIALNTNEECYLVENLLQQLWESIPAERDDYIEKPRLTGYQAIHNAFKVRNDFTLEVQIKTHEMYRKAEFGICSHLMYKIGDKGQKSFAVEEYKKYLRQHPEWFRELNFWELEKKNGYIPTTPFSTMEYVLTPKGDIIELPKGATVVDFAYAVHTDIGDRCTGAFINNKLVKLDSIVKTGDMVKIKTESKKSKPSKDWLKFVKTRRAMNRINRMWKD
jgi:GTP pyrophosphokinase